MSDSTNQTTISRSKSVQADRNGKPTSVVEALGLKKTKDIFSEPHKNWLSNGKQGGIEAEIEQDIECSRLSRPFRSTFDLKTSLSNGAHPTYNDPSPTILRTTSVKSLNLKSAQLNDPLNNNDIPLAATYSSQSDQAPAKARSSLSAKLSIPSIPSAYSSPHLIGMKSPYRRITVSDGHLRSSFPSNSGGGTKEAQANDSLTSKLTTTLPAPAPAMYWRQMIDQGARPPHSLRAHSSTLVGDKIVIFGGCNAQACYNDVYVFDTDTMYWSRPFTSGTPPSPRRAHSATLVSGLGIIVFGGGNSSSYYNDVHILDTVTMAWSSPPTYGDAPSPRRAHSTCFYKDSLYVFGGGDGVYPLNDLFKLDLTTNNGYRWSKIETRGASPTCRGYHSATLLDGGSLIIYGGSDGTDCFDDMFLLDLETHQWNEISTTTKLPRLAHTTTQIGSFLYVVGGRNKRNYVDDLMVFNIYKKTWEVRKVFGNAPSARGYHSTILHDSRLFSFGGYDGAKFFDDMYVLDLSASAYLVQMKPSKWSF